MKNFIKITLTAFVLSALFCISSFASTTITDMTIYAGPDEDASMSGGCYESPVFYVNANGCHVSSYTTSTEPKNPKNLGIYELTIDAETGFCFPSSSNAITINAGTNVDSVTKKTVEDTTTLTIRVKAYSYYKWEAPTVTGDITDNSVKVTKGSAPKFEYIVEYVDQSGNEKSHTGSSTGTSISLKSYNKAYTGTSTEKADAYVTGVAVRVLGAAGNNTKVAPSDWTIEGSLDPSNYNFTEYESWDEFDSGSAVTGNSSSGSSSTSNASQWNKGRWSGSGETWYWYNTDGTMRKNDWVDDNGNWYYLGPDGLMKYGWFTWNGDKYYLNTVHDGTFGKMMTGTVTIEGKSYTFNTSHDGTYGKLIK